MGQPNTTLGRGKGAAGTQSFSENVIFLGIFGAEVSDSDLENVESNQHLDQVACHEALASGDHTPLFITGHGRRMAVVSGGNKM